MTDPWVPYEGETPAFTIQRPHYSDVTGGDFVRAGSGGLPRTAVRYQIAVPDSQSLATQSSLVAVARSYDRIELMWGWPIRFSAWTEVALVRSAFGHPSTVNDGMTIFSSTRTDYPAVDAALTPLSVLITDSPLPGGRWYYYTLFFFVGTEWVSALWAEALVPRNFGHQQHLWEALPPYYQWVDSRFRSNDGYLHQYLNMFGFELDQIREYVESWQDVYHADFSPIQLLKRVGENLGLAEEQGIGEIRYRALVGQLSQLYERRGTLEGIRLLIEVSSKFETLLTEGRNLMLLPDDSDFSTGPGNWVLGGGGTPTTAAAATATAAGSASNATVLINATNVYAGAAAATGTAYTNTPGYTAPNYGFDSTVGVGQAAGSGTAFNASISYPIVIVAPYQTDDRIAGFGSGVLHVSVPAEVGTRDVIIQAGSGVLDMPGLKAPKVLTPKYNGIPVKQGNLYGFTVEYKGQSSGSAGIYWYDKNERLVSFDEALTPSPGDWQALTVQNSPPVGAIYAVPYVKQSGRTAGYSFSIMGAMFYLIGDTSTVTALSPDYYLTLGNVDELIGTGTSANRVIGDTG